MCSLFRLCSQLASSLMHMIVADAGITHKHKCPTKQCGFVWEHENGLEFGPEEDFEAEHRCPICGNPQYQKYFVDKADEDAYLQKCKNAIKAWTERKFAA